MFFRGVVWVLWSHGEERQVVKATSIEERLSFGLGAFSLLFVEGRICRLSECRQVASFFRWMSYNAGATRTVSIATSEFFPKSMATVF